MNPESKNTDSWTGPQSATSILGVGRQRMPSLTSDHDLFIELEELMIEDSEMIWKETARWIKYEEDLEEIHSGWGKPHISYLSFHSITQLIKGLESGIILLDLDQNTLPEISETIADVLVGRNYVNSEYRQEIIDILLLKHKHVQGLGSQSSESENGSHRPFQSDQLNIFKAIKRKQTQQELDKITKVCLHSEVTAVLVGALKFIKNFVVVFLRLREPKYLSNLTSLPLPTRFIYLLLEPIEFHYDCHEIGRSISSLMSTTEFRKVTYEAKNREDLLNGISAWLDKTVVLPLDKLDKDNVIPILEAAQSQKNEEIIRSQNEQQPKISRTGRLFGGFIEDVKTRYGLYLSDIRDGFSLQCLATVVFMYFAVVSPTIAFGTILSIPKTHPDKKLNGKIGVIETLVGSGVCGVLFGLLSGQPLLLIGMTGPILVLEQSIYLLSQQLHGDVLVLRFWIGFWCFVICAVVTAFDGSWLINYLTRFTTEIFSFVISLIFIYSSLAKIFDTFAKFPLSDPSHSNIALMSLILVASSFALAQLLKIFRNTKFMGRRIRRTLGDFGVPISIFLVSLVDYLITETITEKLDVPDGFQLSTERRWIINPLEYEQVWHIFIAGFPGFLVFILIFIETQITCAIMDKPERKLIKGSGYHLNMMLMGVITLICSIFGFPFVAGGTVRSLAHTSALSVVQSNNAPGEKPKVVRTIEQRVTPVIVSVLILFSVYMGKLLRLIPVPVIFGIILYIGVSSLAGTQLLSRLKLVLLPIKYHPFIPYVRHMGTLRMHMFTFIQIFFAGILLAISLTVASLSFPLFIILIAFIRFFALPKMFSQYELSLIDSEGTVNPEVFKSDDPDFYQEAHMPV